jgi:DNA-binding CsgD family transcriptional regulator
VLPRSPASRIEFVELMYDRSTVLRRVDHIAATATSVRCVLSGGGRPCVHDPIVLLLELIAGAGERRQLLIDPQLIRHPAIADMVARLRPDIRVRPTSLQDVLVFNDCCAVLPLDSYYLNAGVVVLRGPLVVPYGQLFELMWSDASRPDAENLRYDGLSCRQLEVIELLLDGATDDQVATRLGMSSRTVRAVVAQLQEHFGTRSRMALGFQLARSNN